MRRLFLIIAIVATAWAVAVVLTGGIVIPLGFTVFRSRATTRALYVAAAAFLVYALSDREAFRESAVHASERVRGIAPALAGLAAVLLAVHAAHFGTYTAGGSDPYGYVSQAYGWARGQLPAPQPMVLSLPFPSSDIMQAPLGYRPGPIPHTIVPTYAAGLPLLMAISLLFGACGPFLIAPVAAGAFVFVTYALGSRMAGRMVGLLAALIVTTSPIVLTQSEWPMSDIPAAALWTAALLAAIGLSRMRVFAAGILAGAALLVRPNLAPLTLVPFACVVAFASGFPERARRGVLFAVPVVAAAVVVAALNATWYGSPLRSGYGTNEELYMLSNVWPNLQRYPVWLWHSQSPLVLLAFVPLLPGLTSRAARRALWPAAAITLATLASYVAYFAFAEWWYLRFMLPGLGAFAVLMAAGIVVLARRIPAPWSYIAVALCLVFATEHALSYAADAGAFGLLRGERRYITVGEYVRTLPEDAVLFTMQHSGSARFYGGRYTLRYDFIDRDWTGRAPAEIERLGLHPYLLIDDWEAPYVRQQFGLSDGPLPWPLTARLREHGGVTVYDLATKPVFSPPVAISANPAVLCAGPQAIVLQPHHR